MDKDLDPNFGDIIPDMVQAYFVLVKPKESQEENIFIALLPDLGNEEETNEILKDVLHDVLNEGDHFTARAFSHSDLENFDQSLPVLSFNPEYPDDFFWLKPPHDMMH